VGKEDESKSFGGGDEFWGAGEREGSREHPLPPPEGDPLPHHPLARTKPPPSPSALTPPHTHLKLEPVLFTHRYPPRVIGSPLENKPQSAPRASAKALLPLLLLPAEKQAHGRAFCTWRRRRAARERDSWPCPPECIGRKRGRVRNTPRKRKRSLCSPSPPLQQQHNRPWWRARGHGAAFGPARAW
jgi:hypothetical protein